MNDFDDFDREYLARHDNAAWVHKKLEDKSARIDQRRMVMRLPKTSIDILFGVIMRKEFPDHV